MSCRQALCASATSASSVHANAHASALVFSSAWRNRCGAGKGSYEHWANITATHCLVVPSMPWADADSGALERFETSLPRSSVTHLNGGLSPHDLLLHTSRIRVARLCVYPTCDFYPSIHPAREFHFDPSHSLLTPPAAHRLNPVFENP